MRCHHLVCLVLVGCADPGVTTYQFGGLAEDAVVAEIVDANGAELRGVWIATDGGITQRDYAEDGDAARKIAGLRETLADMDVGRAAGQAFRACRMLEGGGLIEAEPGAAVAMLADVPPATGGGVYGVKVEGGDRDAVEAALSERFPELEHWPARRMWVRGGMRDIAEHPALPDRLRQKGAGGVPIDRDMTTAEARAIVETFVAERGVDCADVRR